MVFRSPKYGLAVAFNASMISVRRLSSYSGCFITRTNRRPQRADEFSSS